MSDGYCITSEEIGRGPIPDWLLHHIRIQSLDSSALESGETPRILVIYPNENTRRQALSEIGLRGAVDRTLHHTIESLIGSLIADLRLPRLISTEGPFSLILHSECQKEASKLGFPLINPLPEMKWGKGKTAALSSLHHQLSMELVAENWEGPGIFTFRKILTRLENRLSGTHPDMAPQRIIDSLESGEVPFTLSDVNGIIMLDHSPIMTRSHVQILLSLSKHRPIHQLVHQGNFRLGHHGKLLLDEHPVEDSKELPSWVPSHSLDYSDKIVNASRILLRREKHSFQTTIDLVNESLRKGCSRVTIVDPSADKNRHIWDRMLGNLGISLGRRKARASSHPICHWILSLANLPHGSEAFSLERLRNLALQSSIVPFYEPDEHPTVSSIIPKADPEILTSLARSEHVLGGAGALSKWIETLSRPPIEEKSGLEKESAQWWLLCLANSLLPLMRGEDRELIRGKKGLIGCHSGQELPLPRSPSNGDQWLDRTLKIINLPAEMSSYDGNSLSPASALQSLVENRQILRQMQSNSSQDHPLMGPDWVEELNSLARDSTAWVGGPNYNGGVVLMTPSEALGSTSDVVIMSNLSSTSWDLRVPKVAFLGEEERHSLDILRPDSPIREARHCLRHILHSGSEVFILDPSMDETSPPAAPIREWARDFDKDGTRGIEIPILENDTSPRGLRQQEGKMIQVGKPPTKSPLNPSSVSIPLDPYLQRDRERRQPTIADHDGYLPDSAFPYVLTLEKSNLHGKSPDGVENPRQNLRWPVIGGVGRNGDTSLTIDPRPLSPAPSGSKVSDSRHGHLSRPKQEIQIWSPTRLQDWHRCPRMAWLSRELRAQREEKQDEDVDSRTHGELLHNVHHDIFERALGLSLGEERNHESIIENTSLLRSGLGEKEIMMFALESLDSRAPWLERTDAVATHRLRTLTGMDRKEWSNWLANPVPTPLSGRVGGIISAELQAGDSAPLAIEWEIGEGNTQGVEISAGKYDPIRVRGWIDRVDLLPHDEDAKIWVDEAGSESVAPIRVHGSGWTPKRIVAIRDLKTSESGFARKRHYKGLLEELQLAIYARAWEVSHPGDLVLGAGISVLGHTSEHHIELSPKYSKEHHGTRLGTRSSITSELHRFPEEGVGAKSDHFRAWLAQRLTVAQKVASKASSGKVHPTPSSGVCSYCPVRSTCNVSMEGLF